MYNLDDDIVALATLAGKSALNVVRVSGKSSLQLYKRLTKKKSVPKPNYITLHDIYNPKTKKLLDQAMVVYYASPKSFTGEDCLEIMTHGGVVIASQLIDACLFLGAKEAMPGEFSYRAFINNKIDLLQAESISMIASSTNDIDAYYAVNNTKGGLSEQINQSHQIIQDIITIGEHELDFDEGEITETKSSEYLTQLKKALSIVQKSLDQSYVLENNQTNQNIVIVGLPNVGKSSLFNALIGKSKAIVTNEKGTTRDVLEQSIYLGEHIVNLIDTAGLRKTKNKIEKIGIKKSLEEIERGDVIIIVDDRDPSLIFQKIKHKIKNKNVLLVQNKIDVEKKSLEKNIVFVSCKNKRGIKKLTTELSTIIKQNFSVFIKENTSLINKRQKTILTKVERGLAEAIKDYQLKEDLTLCLSLLYLVSNNFNALLRPVDKEEILNKIFGDFCVGK